MSHPAYLAPHVEITEFMGIFRVVRYAVFVVIFPGYSVRLPPAVSCTMIGYSFCGSKSIIMRDYLTMHPTGIFLCATKRMVFIIFLLLMAICLQVVQIPLKIRYARGLLFVLLLIVGDLCTVECPMCMYQ